MFSHLRLAIVQKFANNELTKQVDPTKIFKDYNHNDCRKSDLNIITICQRHAN